MNKKSNKRSDRPSSSGMLIFVAAFLGCLLLFTAIGVIWWQVADPDLSFLPSLGGDPDDTATTTTSPQNQPVNYTVEDRFSVAVFITDDQGKLQTVTLVNARPDLKSFAVMGMPGELDMQTTDEDTLARRLEYDGPGATLLSLGVYFNETIDYYLMLSYSDAESLFRSLGSNLVMTLDRNVDQQSSDSSFSIHLDAGQQALTPKQVANLLRCDNWQGGRRERAIMHAAVIEAYLNQFIAASRDLEEDYADLMKLASSNLSSQRFNLVKKPLEHIADNNTGDITETFYATGNFEGSGDTLRFTPDNATKATVNEML